MGLTAQDFEKIYIEQTKQVATLVVNLQESVQRGLIHKKVVGVEAAYKNNQPLLIMCK